MKKFKEFFGMFDVFSGLYIPFLMLFGTKEIYYSCPNCNHDIKYPQSICHNCSETLDWNPKLDWKK